MVVVGVGLGVGGVGLGVVGEGVGNGVVVGTGVWLGVQSVQQPRPGEEGLHQGQVQTHESHQGGRHKRHLQTK